MNQSGETIAQLQSASKRYGDILALDQVDLEVRRGEVQALLGPNGAGKTTAISLLLGLLQPDAGTAVLFGQSPQSLSARSRLGAMLQTSGVPDTLTVGELITLFRSYYAQPRTVADCVALAGVAELLPTRYGRLSGGQQRRVQFALSICGRPQILFLDEPTTGLDLDARETMWKTIRQLVAENCAVVLTTHYLEEAEALADHVTVLARGRIVAAGSVQQVRARVAQRRIRCISRLSEQAIGTWPEVRSVVRDGERIEIVTDLAETVVRQLLFEDGELRELEVRRAGLAEAFVEITPGGCVMNALTATNDSGSGPNPMLAYALEAKYEFVRVLRTPAFAFPTLLFPPMFYLLFGLLLNRGSDNAAHYLFATYSVFGVMAPSLFGFGVGVAIERERGWLALKRVAPMPPGAYLLAKMAMAALFALIIYLVLATMAVTIGGVRLAFGQWLLLGTIATSGVLPFCALGLMIGSRANASGAPALVNLIYLPMAFLSGLWMPLTLLPDFIGRIAPLWPAYHLAQLALATIGRGDGSAPLPHVAALLGFTAICFAIARRWLARAT